MQTQALIGLGSNLGDRQAHLDTAVAALSETQEVDLRAVSSYHDTSPVGGPAGQDNYLNAALLIETTLDPLDLLHLLQRMETDAGRVRTVRWGERPLDLDLLLFGDRVISTGPVINRIFGGHLRVLTVPHPRMAVRRFVLEPACEVAPDLVEPITGQTLAALLSNLDRRPSYVALHDPLDQFRSWVVPRLLAVLEGALFVPARIEHAEGAAPPTPGLTLPDEFRAELMSQREALCPPLLESHPEDRWIVSDFWFDSHYLMPEIRAEKRDVFRQEFLEIRREILVPQFVVAATGTRRLLRRSAVAWGGEPELGRVPVLEVDPLRPESILNEVLAACAATRSDV